MISIRTSDVGPDGPDGPDGMINKKENNCCSIHFILHSKTFGEDQWSTVIVNIKSVA